MFSPRPDIFIERISRCAGGQPQLPIRVRPLLRWQTGAFWGLAPAVGPAAHDLPPCRLARGRAIADETFFDERWFSRARRRSAMTEAKCSPALRVSAPV